MEFVIFLGRRTFTISDNREKCFTSANGVGTSLNSREDVNDLFDFFEQSPITDLYVFAESPESVLDSLKNGNRFIRAAGGAVSNGDNDILLIRRLGYWDLPKGKMEESETEEAAAYREIEEECGISGVEITGKIMNTYHVYRDRDNRRVIKQTAWFSALYRGNPALKPQYEEDITEALWIPLNDIDRYIAEMYASLRDVMVNVQLHAWEYGTRQSFAAGIKDLRFVAQTIYRLLNNRTVVALYGEMGAGKTTLIKALCHEAGIIENVTSPTFSLVNEYKSPENKIVYHFDFYRINSIAEVYDLGYEEYFYSGELCFIEWPEMIEEFLPEDTVRVYIRVVSDGRREIII
ncbi:MAG: tRNA (adenosine(37)-N6)-threonylcarbamoyltransferase complex ATPase subunit type 1 TsaE [Prevotellaceae bacterium]|jgi:tRNA threonylcarbamoyladenosine biosynthesis protein TsaE|nr:tRNA (adenosine(37)-N6)-threonylcarbamoyltransferase complex ATPase subunit type 1 TsaE [Prevotellaceae bacterium]